MITFAKRAGFGEGIPKFDFELPGVTAISCDTHKYAFCPKGELILVVANFRLLNHHVPLARAAQIPVLCHDRLGWWRVRKPLDGRVEVC